MILQVHFLIYIHYLDPMEQSCEMPWVVEQDNHYAVVVVVVVLVVVVVNLTIVFLVVDNSFDNLPIQRLDGWTTIFGIDIVDVHKWRPTLPG